MKFSKFFLFRFLAAIFAGLFIVIEVSINSIANNPDNIFWVTRLYALPLEIIMIFIILKLRNLSLK